MRKMKADSLADLVTMAARLRLARSRKPDTQSQGIQKRLTYAIPHSSPAVPFSSEMCERDDRRPLPLLIGYVMRLRRTRAKEVSECKTPSY